jgi:hypothetical protein
MSRTVKELAQEVIAVQNASNIRGVVRSFGEAMTDLGKLVPGGDELATHPITVMWVSKLESLSRYSFERFGEAYNECQTLAGE